MDKRFWFGINKKTNPFGFGCCQIAGKHSHNNVPNGWGDIDESKTIDILCYAMENGIDFFDTAQSYNGGKSEELLGNAIKITGKPVILCTKVPLTNEEVINKKIAVEFKKRVELSLNNLQLPYIDILLIHNPPDDIDWKNFNFEILDSLVENKIIGTYGVSSRRLKGARNVIENKVGTTLEWVFNIFERRPIKELFPTFDENRINFIARSPLSRGLINSKYLKTAPVFDNED
jgi:aryl-alcohol dehydrogenase-like predicted oxidoreductase